MKNQHTRSIGFLLYLFLLAGYSFGQNMVKNPGFEKVITPSCMLTIDTSHFSGMVQDWSLASLGTADLRTTLVGPNCLTHCNSTNVKVHGRQSPYEGNVMVGIYTYSFSGGGNYREYVETELKTPMQPGETYYCEMQVSRAEQFALSSNNIGMYFSDSKVFENGYDYLQVTPQINYVNVITDTNGWVKVSAEIVATSSWKYMTIGNFFSNTDTKTEKLADPGSKPFAAYYFVDQVIVRKGKSWQVIDTVICFGDTLTIDPGDNTAIRWSLVEKPDSVISTMSALRVSPTHAQSYILFGESDTLEYHVDVIPSVPAVDLGEDTINVCIHDGDIVSKSFGYEDVDYLWQDGSTDSSYEITKPGIYWLRISNSCGESSDTLIAIDEGCDCLVFVPNVFTPNHDSLNEDFGPEISCDPEEYHLLIFNRWGELLFESFRYEDRWDGTYRGVPVPEGAYFWLSSFTDDQSGFKQRTPLSGTVTVLR